MRFRALGGGGPLGLGLRCLGPRQLGAPRHYTARKLAIVNGLATRPRPSAEARRHRGRVGAMAATTTPALVTLGETMALFTGEDEAELDPLARGAGAVLR